MPIIVEISKEGTPAPIGRGNAGSKGDITEDGGPIYSSSIELKRIVHILMVKSSIDC